MKVHDVPITPEQIDAAYAAMTGTFRMSDVTLALCRAGVPSGGLFAHVADRAADRLLQAARKAGRIRVNPGNKREWIAACPAIAIEAAKAGETHSGSTVGESAGLQGIAQTPGDPS